MEFNHTKENIDALRNNFKMEVDKSFEQNLISSFDIKEFNVLFESYLKALLKTEFDLFLDKQDSKNYRNGYSNKLVKTVYGEITLQIPRDRNGAFKSEILNSYSSCTKELATVIIKLYQLGLSHNDVCIFLNDIYNVKYSKQSISNITSVTSEIVVEYKNRRLDSKYIALFLDATYIPVKFDKSYEKHGVHLIVAINVFGQQEIIGYTIGFRETLSLWEEVLDDIKKRGVTEVDIIVSDGFIGLESIVKRRFPNSKMQRCSVHILRNLFDRASKKDIPAIKGDFSNLLKFTDRESYNAQLEYLKIKYKKYSETINRLFDDPNTSTFLDFPPKMHRTIKTTNRIEGVNQKIKTRIKFKKNFPNLDSFERILVSSIIQQNNSSNKPVGGLKDYINKINH